MEAYIQIGMENISIEKVKVNFLGEEHWGIKTTAESEGMTFHSMQLFNYWVGNYGVTLTVGSWEDDNTQAILDLFYPVG